MDRIVLVEANSEAQGKAMGHETIAKEIHRCSVWSSVR